MVYRKVLKYQTGKLDKTKIFSLTRLDTLVTDALDSLPQKIEDTSKVVPQKDHAVNPDVSNVSKKTSHA